MIYFDNSATTNFKPIKVKFAVIKAYQKKNLANPGRSGHFLSSKVALKIYKTREKVAKYFGLTDCNNVIFTSGCTESLNMAILGCIKPNGHIVTTVFEHNSVLRPLQEIASKHNIEIDYVSPANASGISAQDIESKIKSNTYMVITNHISNVTGAKANVHEIGKLCREKNIIYLVDAAQSAGHIKINMENDCIDLLAVACHKGLYGPSGLGLLLVSKPDIIIPTKFGGTGTYSSLLTQPKDMPDGFEAGTCAFSNIMILSDCIDWLIVNRDKIEHKGCLLTQYALTELSKIKNLTCYTPKNCLNSVITFNIENLNSGDIANYLNYYKIYVRSGIHCAPLAHKYLKTEKQGSVRISFAVNNTIREIKKFIKYIKIIAEQ